MTEENNVYKYKVIQNGKIILRGWTTDLGRRASEHKAQYPSAVLKRVGRKTTPEKAEHWLGEY